MVSVILLFLLEITNAGAITIKDIVHKQSGIEYDKITITEQISDNQQTSSEKSE